MKLKSKVVMILLLSSMLLLTLFASMNYKKRNQDDKEEEIIENIPSNNQRVIPSTFKGQIIDNYNVPSEILDLICNYMDTYYLSIFELESQDFDQYFTNELMSSISNNAVKLLVDVRKMYDFDFRMNKAHYDLNITNYSENNGTYYVDLLENDYMNFMFLNNIESQVFDVINNFEIVKEDNTYKINKLYKEQGYYLNFYDDLNSKDEVSKQYDYYINEFKQMIDYYDVLRQRAKNNPYLTDLRYANSYDRNKAIEYLDGYYNSRNEKWYNFTEVGGNCQNYASQALLAGGIPMDYLGEQQWKCYMEAEGYDPGINEEESPYGRSRSWVGVGYFYDYAKYNDGYGLVSDVNANLFYGEPGDIIIVGNGGLAHTVMISKVVDGHILVDSNSIDMKDFPIEAYTYTNVLMIKILGYN